MGLRQEYTYDEVLRAVETPLEFNLPNRHGVKMFRDIFYNNLINDQATAQGDVAKAGFGHEAPHQPPPRPDVFFDAQSDAHFDGGGGHGGHPGSRGSPGGGDGDSDVYMDEDDDIYPYGDVFNAGGGGGGGGGGGPPSHPFGPLPANLPIQSGHLLPDFIGAPLVLPELSNPMQQFIQEEGLQSSAASPPQPPGFFGQAGQSASSGFQEGAINRVSEIGALTGGAMAEMAANRLRAVGSAVRDHAVLMRDFYFRSPEIATRPTPPPGSWLAMDEERFIREQHQAFREAQMLAEAEEAEAAFGAAGAEAAGGFGMGGLAAGAAEAGGLAAGALEGAELGALGGPLGVAAGAVLGGAIGETASLMFRSTNAPQSQSTFLDARSLNNMNQGVRPLQPRLNRFTEERASGSADSPSYFPMNSRAPSASSRATSRENSFMPSRSTSVASSLYVERGNHADIMRPTSSRMANSRERSAQSIIDATAEPAMDRDRVSFPINAAPQVIQGDPNPAMMADRVPKGSYADVMRATAAPTVPEAPRRNNKRMGGNSGSPYAFPFSGAPSLPAPTPSSRSQLRNRSRGGTLATAKAKAEPAPKARPTTQERNRRNRGPPKKDDPSKKDDQSKR